MLKAKYILLVSVLMLVAGCKSTREFYDTKGELKKVTDAKLINSVEENYIDYSSLFFKKFKAEISFNGDNKSFKGNLFVRKDSSIIVSINPLMGIELFRVRLTPGKVEIIDRTKKNYSSGDYEILWEKFLIELDYYTLQQILTNQMFVYPIDDESKALKRYKHYQNQDVYQFQSVKEGKFTRKYKKEKTDNMIFHQFDILPDVFKVKNIYIRDFSVNSEVSISYSNFTKQGEKLMPSLFVIDGSRGNDTFRLTIDFEHIQIDGNNAIGFKISERYKKIDLQHAN